MPHPAPEARRTPILTGALILLGTALSLALVVATVESADEVFDPPPGALGLDAGRVGPRVLWSRVVVPARSQATDAAAGAALYKAWCVVCHGEKGDGAGVLAKAYAPPPRDFTKGRFRLRTTPEGSLPSDGDLYRTISAGILPSRMPSFAFLTERERWALVDEVKRLSSFYDEDEEKTLNHFELRPSEPEASFASVSIPSDAAAIERGRVLYFEKGECWKCHGQEGLGDGPSAPTLVAEEGNPLPAANLRRGPAGLKGIADARDVYRVLTLAIAGTPMPSYVQTLGEEGVRDLAAFTANWWRIEERALDRRIPGGNTMPTARDSQLHLGQETYLANCAGCHGKLGRGDGAAAAGFAVRPANLAAGFFKFKSTPEGAAPLLDDVKRTLRHGVPGTSMPEWRLHSESELEAVAAYVMALGGWKGRRSSATALPGNPTGDAASAEAVERGRAAFEGNCSICHGASGRGDGPFATILQDYRGEWLRPRNLRDDRMKLGESPQDLYRAVSWGFEGTPMPGFASMLDERTRLDLVAFLLSLREAPIASLR